MLYKVVLTVESVEEILECNHSNESYWAVLSCGAVYYAVQGGSKFRVCGWNPKVWPFKSKLLSSTLLWCCFYKLVQVGFEHEVCGWDPKVWQEPTKLVENDSNDSYFCKCEWNPKVQPFKWNLWSSTSLCLLPEWRGKLKAEK